MKINLATLAPIVVKKIDCRMTLYIIYVKTYVVNRTNYVLI